ncbi:hypothetical protein ACHQM5_029023 [Ranunculus cassubicifolius]
MSALVCGKRSFFEELPSTPPLSKRFRCSSVSPTRLSPPRNYNPFAAAQASSHSVVTEIADIDRLRVVFPEMDEKLLQRALEECGDLDSAIKSLNELRLGSAAATVETDSSSQELDNGPRNGAEWVELLVKEMTSATDINDAKARASRVLEVLEKSICSQVGADSADNLHKENLALKEQMEILIRENGILKRAVAIQHERQKEADNKNQELQHLKQLVSQYQERVKALELNNYALEIHLKQAQQSSSSFTNRYNPDVF